MITHMYVFPTEELIQFTALTWMKTFLGLAQRSMMGFTANFLVSILPCVAYDSNKGRILVLLLFPEELLKFIELGAGPSVSGDLMIFIVH